MISMCECRAWLTGKSVIRSLIRGYLISGFKSLGLVYDVETGFTTNLWCNFTGFSLSLISYRFEGFLRKSVECFDFVTSEI